MEGWVEVSNLYLCPRCNGLNNTTGTLCVLCSIEEKVKNGPDFSKKVIEAIKDLTGDRQNG